MNTVLFLAHVESDGVLAKSALEALAVAQTVAAKLQAPLAAGLFGENVQAAASLIGLCGASRFLGVEGPAQPGYSGDAAAAEALARASNATVIVAAHTSRPARVMAGVAYRLGGCIDTHVSAVECGDGGLAITRWFYRQRIEGTLRRTGRPWFLLVDPGIEPAYEAPAAAVAVESISVAQAAGRTRAIGLREPAAAEQTIRPDARLLLVAGAGWTRKQKDGQPHVEEAEQLILEFLRGSRASLGSTKSLTDISGEGQAVLHCLSHLNQVGQTGSTPRHPKGLSTCCHGEEPHMVGWRFIRERRAVNLDANCGWARGKADVLYVADAFEVMRQLNLLLAAKQE
jgi:electron transfer flavoprotein alpha subunit